MVFIDREKCIGCGSCVRDCCMGVLMLEEKKAAIHPRRRCISCMHCAAVCPVQAVGFDGLSEAEIYPEMTNEPLEKLIRSRRSVRNYQEKLPPREWIVQAMNVAQYAPSGKNQRAYHYTVIWGKHKVAELRTLCLNLCAEFGEAPELNKLMEHGTDLLTCGAPCMIVACSPDDCLNPVLDPAVAMTQMELLLTEKGLGTCWGGYLRQVSDRFPEVRAFLGIPEGCRVRCALMVGYPKGVTYHNPIWRPSADAVWLEEDV